MNWLMVTCYMALVTVIHRKNSTFRLSSMEYLGKSQASRFDTRECTSEWFQVNGDVSLGIWLNSILSGDFGSWGTFLVIVSSIIRLVHLNYLLYNGIGRISFSSFENSNEFFLESDADHPTPADDSASRNWDEMAIVWFFYDSLLYLELTLVMLLLVM